MTMSKKKKKKKQKKKKRQKKQKKRKGMIWVGNSRRQRLRKKESV